LLCEYLDLDRSVFEENAIDIKWRERKAIEKKRNERKETIE
jgi:hypothetical protein